MAAVGFAVVALLLFILAVAEVVPQWAYYVSIAAGVVAVVLGLPARRDAATAKMATAAVAIGGIVVLFRVGWIILNLLGVVED